MSETPGASSTRSRIRLLASAVCAALLAVTATGPAGAAHADEARSRPVVTTNQTGTHDGYRNAGQCSGLQAGGEGPRWEGRQGPSSALTWPVLPLVPSSLTG